MAAATSSMAQSRSNGETGLRLDIGWLRRILAWEFRGTGNSVLDALIKERFGTEGWQGFSVEQCRKSLTAYLRNKCFSLVWCCPKYPNLISSETFDFRTLHWQLLLFLCSYSGLLKEVEFLSKEKLELQCQAEKDHSNLRSQMKVLEVELEEQLHSNQDLATQLLEVAELKQQIEVLEKQLKNQRQFMDVSKRP